MLEDNICTHNFDVDDDGMKVPPPPLVLLVVGGGKGTLRTSTRLLLRCPGARNASSLDERGFPWGESCVNTTDERTEVVYGANNGVAPHQLGMIVRRFFFPDLRTRVPLA